MVNELKAPGGITLYDVTKTSNYTLTGNDDVVYGDTSSAGFTLTLPSAVTSDKRLLHIKKTTSLNTLTLTPAAGLIEGAASLVLYSKGAVVIGSDGTNWNVLADFGDVDGLPTWVKLQVSHTALQTGALTNNITLFALPAGGVLHAVKTKTSTAFAGTSITNYSIAIGLTGELDRYQSYNTVFSAVTATNFQNSSVFDSQDNAAATNIKIAAISVGANLSASTAGVLEVGLLISICTLP